MKKDTQGQLLEVARQEFLEKGFKDASLRNIAAAAGLTTGAIYAHYPDKAALFQAIVSPVADSFMAQFVEAQEGFTRLPEQEQIGLMFTYSDEALQAMLGQVYDNFPVFKLLFCRSAGTEYEHYLHRMIEIECEGTHRFIQVLKRNGYPVREMSDSLIHILNSSYFNGIFETVVHDMPREEAFALVRGLVAFFNAGWAKVLGTP